MSNQNIIKVKVRDTETIYFEGEVDRISSYNEVGPFDVYPTHANFISILLKELSLYQNKKKVKDLKIEQAIMKVKKDIVNIFLGIETYQFEEKDLNAPPTPQEEKK